MRFTGSFVTSDPHPIAPILAELRTYGIQYITEKSIGSSDDEFSTIIIRKKANTSMQVSTSLQKVWKNPHSYKATYYTPTEKPIQVVEENISHQLSDEYYALLNSVLLGNKKSA